jgi:hypothetical protein
LSARTRCVCLGAEWLLLGFCERHQLVREHWHGVSWSRPVGVDVRG